MRKPGKADNTLAFIFLNFSRMFNEFMIRKLVYDSNQLRKF